MRLNYWLFLLFTVLMLASLSHAVTQCPLKGCDCGKICTRTFDCVHGQHKKHKRVDTRLFIPSKESLKAQNDYINSEGLSRYNGPKELKAAIKNGELVYIPSTFSMTVHIPKDRRYARPWVIPFLNDISIAYTEEFPNSPLLISSAVRTRQVQRSLRRWNKNAAPAHGEIESSHLAGTTVDIARGHMTNEQTQFMEKLLLTYVLRNEILVEEENGQLCFHVMVRRPTNEVCTIDPRLCGYSGR